MVVKRKMSQNQKSTRTALSNRTSVIVDRNTYICTFQYNSHYPHVAVELACTSVRNWILMLTDLNLNSHMWSVASVFWPSFGSRLTK